MAFSVRLDVFEGPLDLLLHLVSRERVDVATVSISAITEEYMRAVREVGETDLETASSFLVVAATLLELKSLKLLPGREAADPEVAALLEERDRLLHRLVEYATFKGAAGSIAEALRANEGFHSREPDLPEEVAATLPDLLEGVSPDDLGRAAARVLAPRAAPPVDVSHIAPIRVSVREMIDLLTDRVRARGTTTFGELCREAATRIEVVVRFLALLELVRTDFVQVEQGAPLGDIVVRWREPWVRSG